MLLCCLQVSVGKGDLPTVSNYSRRSVEDCETGYRPGTGSIGFKI